MTDLLTHIQAINVKTQAWIDEAPGRFAGMLVEDLDHWHEYGIYTPSQFDRYMDECCYSDMYKDMFGVRPRNIAELSDSELKRAIAWVAQSAEDQAAWDAEEGAYVDMIEAEGARVEALYNSDPIPYEDEDLKWG